MLGVAAIVAVVTARGGSVGLPGKNLALFLGRPLVEHAVATARAVSAVDRVLLTTDDDRIAAAGARAGAEHIARPAELATATSRSIDAVLHALEAACVEDTAVVVLLQPTSPLRTPADVAECLALYGRHGVGSVVQTVQAGGHHPLKALLSVGDALEPVRDWADLEAPRQDLPVAVRPTGGVYVAGAGDIRRTRQLVIPPVVGQQIPAERAADIDTAADLAAAERWVRQHRGNERRGAAGSPARRGSRP